MSLKEELEAIAQLRANQQVNQQGNQQVNQQGTKQTSEAKGEKITDDDFVQ